MRLTTAWTTLTLAAALGACGTAEKSPPTGEAAITDSTGAERRWMEHGLELVATIGGTAEDTTLLNPYRLAMGDDAIYVVDANQRILSFGFDGTLRWAVGRMGAGPGEFRRIRAIQAMQGQLHILDAGNARLTVLDEDGSLVRSVPIRAGHSEEFAVLNGSRSMLFPFEGQSDYVVIDDSGQAIGSGDIPWPAYHEMEYLAKQVLVTQSADSGTGWVTGFRFGNGWFSFDADGEPLDSARHFYVEAVSFPEVIKERNGNSLSIRIPHSPSSALSATIKGDTLFVLFGGTSADSGRKVDLYRVSSGGYLGSFLLPARARLIGANQGTFAWIESDPVPALRIARRGPLARR